MFFRASAREQASRLRLRGGVSNLPDGSVEVVAEGKRKALQRFREWLQVGPPLAKVEEVRCEVLEKMPEDFRADLFFPERTTTDR